MECWFRLFDGTKVAVDVRYPPLKTGQSELIGWAIFATHRSSALMVGKKKLPTPLVLQEIYMF